MSTNEMEYVIGMDFGNFFCQPCTIVGADPITKRGGALHDLTDPSSNTPYGIPTAFFFAANKFDGNPVCGEQAVKAVPPANCLRYLKRDMMKNGQPNSTTIDGRTFTYDEMIVAAVQHALRIAADQMRKRFNIVTNKVALAYPASMSSDAKNHLVELVERATLPDGRHFEVVGTIAEPAAAALNYLAQDTTSTEERTVLVYDFGAGTFDVSIVAAYPDGRTRDDGSKYYYDVLFTDGIPDLGGAEIDNVLRQMMMQLAGDDAEDRRTAELIRISAEAVKRDLSSADVVQPQIMLTTGFMEPIHRADFEARIRDLIQRTVDMVANALRRNQDLQIDSIVLTGGSSQMPIVQRMLEEQLPAFRGKVVFHQPSKAIGAGAARYGVPEKNTGVTIGGSGCIPMSSAVVVRTIRDIGVRFYRNKKDNAGYIDTYVPSGTPIPFASPWLRATKLDASNYTRFRIYEANNSSPDVNAVDANYDLVCEYRHDHGRLRPADYPTLSRIVIDEKHMAHIEVQEPENASVGTKRQPFRVDKNLKG